MGAFAVVIFCGNIINLSGLNGHALFYIDLTAFDVDADALTYAIDSATIHGTLTGEGPNLTYLPDSNYNGVDSLTFKVNDGQLDSQTVTVSITINAVNDAPVAVDDAATTNEGTAVEIVVLANDTDVDGQNLTLSEFTQPGNGQVEKTGDGALTYTPTANFHGADSFDYTVSDGSGETDTGTVYVTVDAVNYPPAANEDTATTAATVAVDIDVLANDTDADGLSYFLQTTKQDYLEIFNLLADKLPGIASGMREIESIYFQDKVAKYRIKRQETVQGQTYDITYYIYFVKDANGLWNIESF